jgi:hexosaminidase
MANVLEEVAALFPAPYIHVGADEVQPDRWRACPVCKKRMEELAAAGLPAGVQPLRVKMVKGIVGKPFYEDIGSLQSDFIRRIDGCLREKGKRMVGWDEILDGGLASDSQAVVMAWRSPAAVSGALSQGRDAVASLYPECYLDYPISLSRTYAFEPVPADSPKSLERHVLGVQGNMWGEETKTRERVDKQTFPRLCALAEVGWTPRESRNFTDFSARLKRHAERLRPYGIEVP